MKDGKIVVMMAGLPGKMATLTAEVISSQQDMELYPYALSEESKRIELKTGFALELFNDSSRWHLLDAKNKGVDLIVDFTLPKSVNCNAKLYCISGIPFVMGTTGGDRQLLAETVRKSLTSAVIATNMAVPVVVFQAMIQFVAQNFPGSLKGYKLVISESHQAAKSDPSGSAISLLDYFAALGMPLGKEQIRMVRDSTVQEVEMGIPKEYLDGHGYHTYTILSPDGTVTLQFKHNILGRNTYVPLKAIRFLAKHKGERGKVFSMIDVLKEE